jgi:integrase
MRARRQTKVQPSQMDRRRAKPRKLPGRWYTASVIAHAVRTAAAQAGVAHWHPYQLRHLRAVELRQEVGIDAARAVLGHTAVGMTAHYAKLADVKLASEAAAKLG